MFKKSKIVLTSVLASFIILLIPPAASFAGVCGDVNGDTAVNLADVVYLINYVFKGGLAPDCGAEFAGVCGDVNGDAAVNLADAVYLINYIFKGGDAPYCLPYRAPSTTTIIAQSDTTVIQDYDTTAGIVILDGSSVYAQGVSVGDVIIGQDDGEAPHGFLRKVTSKTAQGGSFVLETEPATMMEAFESMDISETHQLRPSDVESYKLYNGSKFNSYKDDETFVVELDCVLFDLDGDEETTEDQIRLEGQYAFTAAIFAEIQIDWFQLKKFETWIQTNEDANVNLIASMQWEFAEAAEFDLAEFHLGAIPVGGVVWLVPTLTVEAHINGDLTVTVETGITYTQELRYGFGYADNTFYNISESTKDFTYTPPQFTAEFNFEPGVSLNASCLLYGVAGPYMAGKAGFHFQSILSADPCDVELTFDLNAILYAVVGIECDILGLDYNSEYQLYTHLIGEWIYPLGGTGTIAIDPEPNSLNAPWSLVGPCDYSTSGTGDETLTNLDPGDYTITWGAVPGWTTPSNSTQTLAAGQTVTFSGTYTEGGHETGTMTDIDGNTYQTVKIGDQWWLAENLKVTHYRNGDAIPNVTDAGTWGDLATGAYCEYSNDVNNVATYGRLYNWYSVNDSRNIAPAGWHVPTDAEWQTLVDYLGGSAVAGGKMKEIGTTHWWSPNTGATDESGFTGLPGGFRGNNGSYVDMGDHALFWSSTEASSTGALNRTLNSNSSEVHRNGYHKGNGFSIRCVKDVEVVPVLTTADVTEITQTTAECGGTITSDGGAPVTARGVCWSTNPTPTVADNTTTDGTGMGSFTSSITGLAAQTAYFVRAYATNSAGTGYGNVHQFSTAHETGTVTDINGNTYQTVKIGDQWWMAENLKVTHYRNGDAIPNVTDNATWAGLATGAYCEYNNDADNVSTYGRLYNWFAAVDSRNIAPAGWHVPSDAEWQTLVVFLGGEAVAGGKMKEAGTSHWLSPNTGATNESGFSALPGGFRDYDGVYMAVGITAVFWSSTERDSNSAWHRYLEYYDSVVGRSSGCTKRNGNSVRCVRD